MHSSVISTTVVMEGYDVTLLGSFIGYPAFRNKYGVYLNEESGYQISAKWQTGLNDIAAVGNIIGALMNGYFTAKYGHRRVMMATLVALSAMIFIVFFAPTIEVLLVGVAPHLPSPACS
jgi:SP family general alpha glucoside:H+ symporter-like MFS transporter